MKFFSERNPMVIGAVTFTPASLPGVATNLLGLAVTGNTATLNIAIEQHP